MAGDPCRWLRIWHNTGSSMWQAQAGYEKSRQHRVNGDVLAFHSRMCILQGLNSVVSQSAVAARLVHLSMLLCWEA